MYSKLGNADAILFLHSISAIARIICGCLTYCPAIYCASQAGFFICYVTGKSRRVKKTTIGGKGGACVVDHSRAGLYAARAQPRRCSFCPAIWRGKLDAIPTYCTWAHAGTNHSKVHGMPTDRPTDRRRKDDDDDDDACRGFRLRRKAGRQRTYYVGALVGRKAFHGPGDAAAAGTCVG